MTRATVFDRSFQSVIFHELISDPMAAVYLVRLFVEQLEEGVYVGRIFADAPGIDGNIYVTGEGINIGDLIPVEIVDRQDYDLIGLYHGTDDEDDSAEADTREPWEPGQS